MEGVQLCAMTTLGNNSVEQDTVRIRKSSPLRATMPMQAVHRTSPLRLKNRTPETELSPCLDLCPAVGMRGWAWTCKASGVEGSNSSSSMRRTASLDAIYLKGQWPKEVQPHFSYLLLDKTTQTPEEWVACSLAEVMLGCSGCLAESPTGSCQNSNTSSTSSSNSSRRASGSVPSSPWPSGGGAQPPPNTGENIEKLIRQRLQRTNKEGIVGSGPRYSPVQADHSVLAPVPIIAKPTACIQANGAPRSVSIPHLPRPLIPRLRSSVEELNQEIERLVLKTSHPSPEDNEVWCTSQQDGRKAPIPDYFRFTRNANTQTPARCSSDLSGSSSIHTTPSLSPTMSPPPPPVQDGTPPPDSPGHDRFQSSLASPHINKFLAREPPDGCERVSLKSSDEICISGSSVGTTWTPIKPLAAFTLLPSLGSAFYAPPGRVSAAHRVVDLEGGEENRRCFETRGADLIGPSQEDPPLREYAGSPLASKQ